MDLDDEKTKRGMERHKMRRFHSWMERNEDKQRKIKAGSISGLKLLYVISE